MKEIITLGDIHGNWNVIEDFFVSSKLTKVSIIQVGDFGIGFEKRDIELIKLNLLNDILSEYKSSLYITRGNHDNPEYFTGHNDFSNITFVKDHSLLEINGKKVFFIGGAISTDRNLRVEGKGYWKNERINKLSINLFKNKVEQADIIVTHEAPIFAYPVLREIASDRELTKEIFQERDYLYQVSNHINKDCTWIYGHYHKSHTNNLTINNHNVRFILLGIDEFRLI